MSDFGEVDAIFKKCEALRYAIATFKALLFLGVSEEIVGIKDCVTYVEFSVRDQDDGCMRKAYMTKANYQLVVKTSGLL